jgi:hypothetical protein
LEALQKYVTKAEKILRNAGGRTAREIENGTRPEQARDPQGKTGERKGKILAASRNAKKPSRDVIADALGHIPNDMDYDEWIKVGFALYDGLGESGRDLWENWSAQSPKNDPDLTASKWPSFASGNSITVGTLFWHAEQNGWQPPWSAVQGKEHSELPSGYRFRKNGLERSGRPSESTTETIRSFRGSCRNAGC